MKVKIKINSNDDLRNIPGMGPAMPMNRLVEGELGGEPGYPNLILVKRGEWPDLLVTLEGKAMVVTHRPSLTKAQQQSQPQGNVGK